MGNKSIFRYIFFLILAVFSFTSCQSYEHKIEAKLAKIKSGEEFSMSEYEPSSWNIMYILKPQQSILLAETGLLMPVNVREFIEEANQLDSQCVLLFAKDNVLLHYSIVRRKVADFTFLDSANVGLEREQKYQFEKKRIVKLIFN